MRVIVPPMGNEAITMLKMTALVSVIAGDDLMTNLQSIYSMNFEVIPLLLVATLGAVPYDVVAGAMTATGLSPESVDPAEEAGMIVDQDGRWAFRHPLMRAAVYRSATPSRSRSCP